MGTPLDTHSGVGNCWCGQSFFTGSDGINRIVTSQGRALSTWQLQLSPAPHLVLEGQATVVTGQDEGFFTTVSSNGLAAGSAIIWAVGRPTNNNPAFVNLYAYAATVSGGTYTQLFSSPAGTWPHTEANANIVPVVANGKVYVAAYKALTIFGGSGAAALPALQPAAQPNSPHIVSGVLSAIDGPTLTLKNRGGKPVKVDDSQAAKNGRIGTPLELGVSLTAQGSIIEANGALEAVSIVRAKGTSGELWPADR
jgi:hypothetical protein